MSGIYENCISVESCKGCLVFNASGVKYIASRVKVMKR